MNSTIRQNPLEDLDDLDEFAPRGGAAQPRLPAAAIDEIAAATGFPSRQPPKVDAPRRQRRYTTGRSQQINIKATADTIAKLYRVADERNIPLGEVLEQALVALEKSDS